MWCPTRLRLSGPGWLELNDRAIEVPTVELEIVTVPEVRLIATCRLPDDRDFQNDLMATAFARLVLPHRQHTYIAAGSVGSPVFHHTASEVVVPLTCFSISRVGTTQFHPSDRVIRYEIRTAPSLAGLRHSPLESGILSIGGFRREPSPQVGIRCGEVNFRAMREYEQDEEFKGQHPSIHLVEQHVLAFDRAPRPGETGLDAYQDLRNLAHFVLHALGCITRTTVTRFASRTTYTPAEAEERRWVETVHATDSRIDGPPRHSQLDLYLSSWLQDLVSRWPVPSDLRYAAGVIAGTFSLYEETAFVARFAALECLISHWLQERNGRARLRRACDQQSQLWPLDRAGKPRQWRWGETRTPPVGASLWVCFDDVGADWADLVAPAANGSPDFVELRNEIMHGTAPSDERRLHHAVGVVGALAMRLLMRLLDLDVPDVGGSRYWFSPSAMAGVRTHTAPDHLFDPLDI